jgi:hypothetical protein
MCVFSMIAQDRIDKWQDYWPPPMSPAVPTIPTIPWTVPVTPPVRVPTQEELDEFYRLLKKAREYDRKNNEPDCEDNDKKRILREMADKLGVEINFPDEEET